MKFIKLAIVVVILIFISKLFGANSRAQEALRCPEGSYDIGADKNGDPICKLEPTGCPYGDSIPINDVKCVPPPETNEKAPEMPENKPQVQGTSYEQDTTPVIGK